MKKNFAKQKNPAGLLACGLLTLSAMAVPMGAGADSFVDVDGFRYRLILDPDAPDDGIAVYATLVGALTQNAAIMGVKLPDYVYADGVQYPVMYIEPGAYSGYYGIKKVVYNKFCAPRPSWESSEGSYITHAHIKDSHFSNSFEGWSALKSVTVDYASSVTPINIGIGSFSEYVPYPDEVSLSAFSTQYEFTLNGNPSIPGQAILRANMGFSMETVSINWNDRGDHNPSLSIKCAAPTPPNVFIDSRFFSEDGTVELHVPVGTAAAYREADGWSLFADKIYEDIDYAYNPVAHYVEVNGVYYGMEWDESGRIYATVIGPVDRGCTSVEVMESVNWDYQSVPVKKISPCAFMDCVNITSFSLPEGIEVIGDIAFYECLGTWDYTSFDYSFRLPDSIREIGKGAFYGTEVDPRMPQSLKKIGDYAFHGSFKPDWSYNKNKRINNLLLNEGLEYIGDYAFNLSDQGLDVAVSVVIPSTVSHIGCDAFGGEFYGSSLLEMEFRGDLFDFLGDRVASLDENAELTIPPSVSVIQSGSVRAMSVTVGENVTKILPWAMWDVKELWMLPETPPTVYESSFSGESSLPDITLHVKQNCLNAYACHPVWGKFGNIVADIDWVDVTQGDWTFKVDRFYKTAELTGYNGNGDYSAETIAVPSKVLLDGVAYPVETIGKWAISNVQYEQTIEIPASVKRIRNYAITNSKTEKVICKSAEPPLVDMKFPFAVQWPNLYYYWATLYVPEGSADAYKSSDFGKMFGSIVESPQSGVEDSVSDYGYEPSLPVEVYSIGGVLMYKGIMNDSHLPAGIYVIKQGAAVGKYTVR